MKLVAARCVYISWWVNFGYMDYICCFQLLDMHYAE